VENLAKATIVDGIAATERRDSQGEILKLAGVDISQMVEKGVFNDNHGTGFINTLGKITEAKKIFSEADCANARQLSFYKKIEAPFLYVKGHLLDDEDHPNAKAVSAIMKGFRKMGTPMDVKFSVEGKVVDRAPGGVIAQSMVRNVALTLIPANGETAASIAGSTIAKCMDEVRSTGGDVAYADRLIKSIGVVPTNHRWEVSSEDHAMRLIDSFNQIRDIIKMLSPGNGSSGPVGTRVGQSALVSESVAGKLQADKKAKIKKFAKATLEKNPGMALEKAVEIAFDKFR
jgi:hypothetical protein